MKSFVFAAALVLGLSAQAMAAISTQPNLPEKPKQGEYNIQPVIRTISTQPNLPEKPKQGEYNIQPVL